ncbi:MAG: M28 family peptidase [Spirochaetaceae bacterium]|nr:M28 family peptidase [Spirochaetaceae bacterium]
MAAIQRLREDVAELAHAEGRKPGTLGHRRAEHYLVERLLTVGLSPYRGDEFRLPFELPEALRRGGVTEGMNLVAVARGTNRDAAPLLLGAHYDSLLEAPCADDNAAAVAIVLEVAQELVARPLTRDVVVALFDTEEQPYAGTPGMGSTHFHDRQMDSRGVACAVIQDLTGHNVSWRAGGKKRRLPRMSGLLFMTGAESHAELAGAVAACRRPWRLPLIAILNRYIGDVSDHRPFRRAGKPYLFFSCGRWEHYHQESDTPQRLNYRKMRRIARFLTALLARLDALPFDAGSEPVDTTAFELSSLRSAFGPWLPLVRRVLKLGKIESRDDIDRIAGALTKSGL